jgi:hypothetical protein
MQKLKVLKFSNHFFGHFFSTSFLSSIKMSGNLCKYRYNVEMKKEQRKVGSGYYLSIHLIFEMFFSAYFHIKGNRKFPPLTAI